MGLEHLYGRIVTATLGALLCVCAFLAGAKFIRRQAKLVSLLARAKGALFAVLMGGVAATTMITASVKDPPTNMVGRAGLSADRVPDGAYVKGLVAAAIARRGGVGTLRPTTREDW